MTSKLLLEAGFSSYVSRWGWMAPPGALTNFTQVTQLAPFMVFRGLDDYFNNFQSPNVWRASASYVTGAHSLKFGYQGAYLIEEIEDFANYDEPDVSVLRAESADRHDDAHRAVADQQPDRVRGVLCAGPVDARVGMTLQGAVRYDRAWSFFPADAQRRAECRPVQSAADHCSRRRTASTPSTTSRRAWAWRGM